MLRNNPVVIEISLGLAVLGIGLAVTLPRDANTNDSVHASLVTSDLEQIQTLFNLYGPAEDNLYPPIVSRKNTIIFKTDPKCSKYPDSSILVRPRSSPRIPDGAIRIRRLRPPSACVFSRSHDKSQVIQITYSSSEDPAHMPAACHSPYIDPDGPDHPNPKPLSMADLFFILTAASNT